MDLKEADILDDDISKHWYYNSKAKAMIKMLDGLVPNIILDVGAGSGFFARSLLSKSAAKEAWCVDTHYTSDSILIEAGKPVYFRKFVDAVNADLVLLMDVLEHVDDDVGLLKEYIAKVPTGSHFLISVPAFQFLWSGHDIFLEHKRRYTLPEIEKVVERAGLKLKHGAYYFGAVFPIATASRWLENMLHKNGAQPRSQLKQHHVIINEALSFLSSVELPFMKFNRLAGLTAFCLAESK